MTPMIDVTFLLLIFFMCTLKFKILEGKLGAYLPKDVGVQTTEARPSRRWTSASTSCAPGNKVRYDYKSKANVPYTEAHARPTPLRLRRDPPRPVHGRRQEAPRTSTRSSVA